MRNILIIIILSIFFVSTSAQNQQNNMKETKVKIGDNSELLIKYPLNINSNEESLVTIEILADKYVKSLRDLAWDEAFEYLADFELSLVSTEGFIYAKAPKYYLYSVEDSVFSLLTDVDEKKRQRTIILSKLYPSLVKSIPLVGSVFSLSSTVVGTLDWIGAKNLDYSSIYTFNSKYDQYILPFPEFMNMEQEKHNNRALRIEIPVSRMGSDGELFCFVENVTIIRTSKEEVYAKSAYRDRYRPIYPDEKVPIVKQINELPIPLTKRLAKVPRETVVLDKTSITKGVKKLNSNYDNFEIHYEYKIAKEQDKNYLDFTIYPFRKDLFFTYFKGKLIDIGLGLSIPKHVGYIETLPTMWDEEQELEFETEKSLKGKNAITNWYMFGIGSLHPALNHTLNVEGAIGSLLQASKFYEYSFSEYLADQYSDELNFNFFQFPITKYSYRRDEGFSHNFDTTYIRIPIVFYRTAVREKIEMDVYLHAVLLKNAPSSSISFEKKELYTRFTTELTGSISEKEEKVKMPIDKPVSEKSAYPETVGTFIDERDGQEYKWVRIGTQTWMAENLNFRTRTAKYNPELSDPHMLGLFYNCEEAYNACPHGWHLPDKDEWEKLVKILCEEGYSKDVLYDPANDPYLIIDSGSPYLNAFSLRPGGFHGGWSFEDESSGESWFWTSSTLEPSIGIRKYYEYAYLVFFSPLDSDRNSLGVNKTGWSADKKNFLLNVRCVKDR